MHDLTFCREILSALNEKLKKLGKDKKIKAVHVSLSPISHVAPKTLEGVSGRVVQVIRAKHHILGPMIGTETEQQSPAEQGWRQRLQEAQGKRDGDSSAGGADG